MKTGSYIGNISIIVDTEDRVLLGKKKPENKTDKLRKRRRIGMGKWVPPGGGTEPGDKSEKHSAQREVLEESGLQFPLTNIKHVGILEGYLDGPAKPTWTVHIFHMVCFKPNMVEFNRDEFDNMCWFPKDQLPFDEMIESDSKWIPKILAGDKLYIKLFMDKKTEKFSSIKVEKMVGTLKQPASVKEYLDRMIEDVDAIKEKLLRGQVDSEGQVAPPVWDIIIEVEKQLRKAKGIWR